MDFATVRFWQFSVFSSKKERISDMASRKLSVSLFSASCRMTYLLENQAKNFHLCFLYPLVLQERGREGEKESETNLRSKVLFSFTVLLKPPTPISSKL